ncbi:MAG: hypothetical protein SPL64_00210 [Bacteroidaceae bacterium]|nr:hypothetical protein [Bacteroidaceae bacterium]
MKYLLSSAIFTLLAACIFTGCKPDEVIITETRTVMQRDTLRQFSVLRDSIYLRDSIFLERQTLPSVIPDGRDTVRETKTIFKYIYKEKQGRDSVRVVNHTDTIRIKEPDLTAIRLAEKQTKLAEQQTAIEKSKAVKWKASFYGLIAALIGFLGFIIYRKLKPRWHNLTKD